MIRIDLHQLIIAGVRDAVPLDMDTGLDQIGSWSGHSVAFDANLEFLGFTEVDATRYIFDNYVQLTTGL